MQLAVLFDIDPLINSVAIMEPESQTDPSVNKHPARCELLVNIAPGLIFTVLQYETRNQCSFGK